jgi:branched-chain amino acid transport system ATP-binding protein
MLEVQDISAGYGDLTVLRNVGIHINRGEFVAILGSNAAGKTTLMRAITGLLRVRGGQVTFKEKRVEKLPAHTIANEGMALVLEHSALKGLSVHENLLMGAYRKAARPHIEETLERVFALFPVLAQRRDQPAVLLSGGEQQMLCIGRALMSRPELLLLDEPSVGLSPAMVSTILQALTELNRQGMTILLVEQNVAQTLKIVSRAYVLEGGKIVLHGEAVNLLADPSVKRAYLGI